MAVQTITYGDKSYLNELPDIPAINKVQDIDMNEIKSVVNNNANELNNVETFLNLNTFTTLTTGNISGSGTLNNFNITVATNSDASLAKIYGQIDVATNGSNGNVTFQTNLAPTSKIVINGIVYRQVSYNNYIRNTSLVPLTINTDGTVEIPYVNTGLGTAESCRLSVFACLIFVKDFGDTPIG